MAERQFLVAIDLTEEADEVLAAARKLADELEGKLTAITVVRPLTMLYGDMGMGPISGAATDFEAEALKNASSRLTKLAGEYGIEPDDCKIVLGSPATEIRSMAEQMGTEIIVIGTHGRHGIGLVLGSTSNAVLHGVPCDVLVVRIHPDATA